MFRLEVIFIIKKYTFDSKSVVIFIVNNILYLYYDRSWLIKFIVLSKWKLRPEVEWYIQKNANVKELFVNSTEYTLTLLRESKKVEIGIGYRYERFNRNLLVPDPNGQTTSIELNF